MDRPRNRALRGGKTQAQLAQGLAEQLVLSVRVNWRQRERETEEANNDTAEGENEFEKDKNK